MSWLIYYMECTKVRGCLPFCGEHPLKSAGELHCERFLQEMPTQAHTLPLTLGIYYLLIFNLCVTNLSGL